MSNLTFTICIEQTPTGSLCAYLKEVPHLARVEGSDFLEVYREACCQTASLIQERTDLKDIRIRAEMNAAARECFERYKVVRWAATY